MRRLVNAETLLAEIDILISSPRAKSSLRHWTNDDWAAAFADLPLDGATFAARFERSWSTCITGLLWLFNNLSDPKSTPNGVHGYIGLLVLTLESLRYSERHRSIGLPPTDHDCQK